VTTSTLSATSATLNTEHSDAPASSTMSEFVPVEFVQSRLVEAADIDMLGHVSNLAIVRWVQDLAVAHSSAVGLDFAAYEQLGGVFVLRRHEVEYLRSAYLGETIDGHTRLASAKGASCIRTMEFVRAGVTIASSVTTWVYVATGAQRPSRIPDSVRVAFGQRARRAPTSA
jgi:acyl-CoA thioester hydrolase